MSTPIPHEPPRPYRLSDAERTEAISALADAFAEGRLDAEEFDTRMGAASQARLATDLDPLFVDLPQRAPKLAHPKPARVPTPVRAHQGQVRAHHGCRGFPVSSGYGPQRMGMAPHPLVFMPLIILIVATTQLWFFLPLLFITLSLLAPGHHSGRGRTSGPSGSREFHHRTSGPRA